MKRMTNRTAYEVTTNRARYIVVYERLKNGVNGQPRYEFTITPIEFFSGKKFYNEYRCTAVYRSSGHYLNDIDECKFIVANYENELEK